MSSISKLLKANENIILPKTRSERVFRTDNTDYETSINNISSDIINGIIYPCTHSKSGTVHTLTIDISNVSVYSVRFKATADYIDGDTFTINNVSMISKFSNYGFKTESIVECDIDSVNKIVYIKDKPSLIPPYKPTDLPQFTYSGQYETIDDGELGWRIKFKTSGNFNLISPDTLNIDIFLVGGGGGGSTGSMGSVNGAMSAAGAGGGGYTKTQKSVNMTSGTPYSFIIGSGGAGSVWASSNILDASNGGNSSALSLISNGGKGGKANNGATGNGTTGGGGGSGGGGGLTYSASEYSYGIGGSDGANGLGSESATWKYTYKSIGGIGQGTTTREFGESTGDLYAGGGGSGGSGGRGSGTSYPGTWGANGGSGGGGSGGRSSGYTDFGIENYHGATEGKNGTINTGGGGGSAGAVGYNEWGFYGKSGGSGGSGIVIIRNTR